MVQTDGLSQGNYTALSDAFWQLADLTQQSTLFNGHRNPSVGGQNFTHCCLLAVNASLEVSNGHIVENSGSFIRGSLDDLLTAEASGQFPCGAQWNGNPAGTLIVEVPDYWFEANCPGWQLADSHKGDESQWISPFVGFLLPAVIFCLTIPRRRKLAVWQKLFVPNMSQVSSLILAPLAMFVAGITVVCDTLIWLSICFAFASPMLLSGLYEAFLDNRIIGFLIEKRRGRCMTDDMTARLLLVILVGNLDLEIPTQNTDLERTLPSHTSVEMNSRPLKDRASSTNRDTSLGSEATVGDSITPHGATVGSANPNGATVGGSATPNGATVGGSATPNGATVGGSAIPNGATVGGSATPHETAGAADEDSPWAHIENLVHPVRTYSDSATGTPRQWPAVLSDNPLRREDPIQRDIYVQREIGHLKTRLRTMLACQYSFGATVGAPVVFFLGAFAYAIVTTLSDLGDKDTSIALAFGMWYMIIPHISIVSGLLLAGNNPNTLEGVVALEFEESTEAETLDTKIFEFAYESRYKPQWLWLRGRSKRDWVGKVCETYRDRPHTTVKNKTEEDTDIAHLRKATTLSIMNWVLVVGMTVLLIAVPFLLAFLTAFYTPQIGLSCRSFTFTVYAIAQLCQIVLWLWAYGGAPEGGIRFFRTDGFLDQNGFYTPSKTSSFSKKFFSLPSLWAIIWYTLAVIFGVGGVVTAIGGTMMQLMGVYNSDKCYTNAWWWTRDHPNVMVIVSSNYALEIRQANTYWKACAITAIVFLGAVSFCGWWYQRRLRGLFRDLVRNIGNPTLLREDVRTALTQNKADAANPT